MTALLTIGQVARYVGLTIRAIRHYHQRGLLPEPERDGSGYRRYDAGAILSLIRIKTLADAGVPLARIDELLAAPPGRFAAAIAEIDAALQQEVDALEERRRRIADLAAGERLFLPPEFVDYLDELRALGAGSLTLTMERDGWLLLLAADADLAYELMRGKRALLVDPEFARLMRAYEDAYDWEPEDPRLEDLADAMARFVARAASASAGVAPTRRVDDPDVIALLSVRIEAGLSPALRRLEALCGERMQGQRLPLADVGR